MRISLLCICGDKKKKVKVIHKHWSAMYQINWLYSSATPLTLINIALVQFIFFATRTVCSRYSCCLEQDTTAGELNSSTAQKSYRNMHHEYDVPEIRFLSSSLNLSGETLINILGSIYSGLSSCRTIEPMDHQDATVRNGVLTQSEQKSVHGVIV